MPGRKTAVTSDLSSIFRDVGDLKEVMEFVLYHGVVSMGRGSSQGIGEAGGSCCADSLPSIYGCWNYNGEGGEEGRRCG